MLAEAVALVRARRAFVLATVVWRRAPTSGHAGSKAIVFPDGRVHGFLGGACAEPTLVHEAANALAEGRPRLLFLGPADELAHHERDGTRTIPMACESEGALEVHIEPFLPMPQLVVVGRSPAVHALAIQARAVQWDVVVIDDGGDPAEHPFPSWCTPRSISRSCTSAVERRRHRAQRLTTLRSSSPRDRCRAIGVVAAAKRPRCSSTCAIAASAMRTSPASMRPRVSISARSPTPRSRSPCSRTSSRDARPAHSAVSSPCRPVEKRATRCVA